MTRFFPLSSLPCATALAASFWLYACQPTPQPVSAANDAPKTAPHRAHKSSIKTANANKLNTAQDASSSAISVPVCDTQLFIYHLSMAQLLLEQQSENALSPHMDWLKASCSYQDKEPVLLVVFEYKRPDAKRLHSISAPINYDKGDPYSMLQPMAGLLKTSPHTLQDVKLLLSSYQPQPLASQTGDLLQTLNDQQRLFLNHSQNPAAQAGITTQLNLVDYFIDHKMQDAAYLVTDNIRRQLAEADRAKTIDAQTSQNLSARLQETEIRLREQLPYGL